MISFFSRCCGNRSKPTVDSQSASTLAASHLASVDEPQGKSSETKEAANLPACIGAVSLVLSESPEAASHVSSTTTSHILPNNIKSTRERKQVVLSIPADFSQDSDCQLKKIILEDVLSCYPLGYAPTCAGRSRVITLRILQAGSSTVASWPFWNTLNTYYYGNDPTNRNTTVDVLFIIATIICWIMVQKGTGKGMEIAKNFGTKIAALENRIEDLETRKEADIAIIRAQGQMILVLEKRVSSFLNKIPCLTKRPRLFTKKMKGQSHASHSLTSLPDIANFYRSKNSPAII